MRKPAMSLSLAALIAANLAPLLGVIFLGWDAAAIVLLYWAENLVVGFYAILKMATATGGGKWQLDGRPLLIPFFCIHFGGFCAVHGLFLMMFFKLDNGAFDIMPDRPWFGPLVFLQLLIGVIAHLWSSRPPGMGWPLVALLASHGISFVQNYLLGGEYRRLTPSFFMIQPYGRIVLMHVAILFGGMPVMMLGSPLPLLVLLVGLKTFIDALLHEKAHDSGLLPIVIPGGEGPAGDDGPSGGAL